MSKILIVEDDININCLIKDALNRAGMECIQAYSGTEGMLQVKIDRFDVIILDLMLAGLTGEEVLKNIRQMNSTPVIIVSAKDELDSKVDLFAMGADDYITKPFEIKELIARVNVCIRRSAGNTDKPVIISRNGLSIDKEKYKIFVNDNEISLTKQEFKIVELLLSYPDKVFSKQEIYDYAWDEYYIGVDKTINVHISNIRAKIKKFSDTEYIETVWGIGFKAV